MSIFTKDQKFFHNGPDDTEELLERSKYAVTKDSITAGLDKKETFKISFNRWGHMVMQDGKLEITLKLIQRNTDKLPKIPAKICLMTIEGD
ncbi:MAG: hypothetical protein JWR19_291 [Pedosphaera sp.]|nr:hypothetical protein [Pedosphaera sp.]